MLLSCSVGKGPLVGDISFYALQTFQVRLCKRQYVRSYAGGIRFHHADDFFE
jgi:hypothetical protein